MSKPYGKSIPYGSFYDLTFSSCQTQVLNSNSEYVGIGQ